MRRSLSLVATFLLVLFVMLPAHAQAQRGEAFYDLGVFAYEEQDYEGAEEHFLKALGFDPDNPFYIHFLGKTYLKMERYEDAGRQFNRTRELKPDMPGLTYDTAFLYYKLADYVQAADLFVAVVKQEPANTPAFYYAGISLFKQGRFQEALDYFIRAAEQSPSLKAEGTYYAGICLHKLGQFDKAQEKFAYVKEHAEAEVLRDNAVKWLQTLERQKAALKPYSLFLKAGLQYDDNVRLEPLDREDLYADEDDYVTVAYFSGKYNFVNRPGTQVGAGYSHYQTWHDRLTAYDLVGSTFHFFAKYQRYPYTLGLSYLPAYYWVDDDSYLMRHLLRPEVIWQATEDLTARFSYGYYRNNYFTNNNRDGHIHEGSVDLYYNLRAQRGFLFAAIGYESNTAGHLDYYYDQWKTKLGLTIELGWELDLTMTGRYYRKEYDHIDSVFNVQREDDKYSGSLALSRNLFYDWLGLVVEYGYTNNNSNITSYDYKRNTYTLSLTANY